MNEEFFSVHIDSVEGKYLADASETILFLKSKNHNIVRGIYTKTKIDDKNMSGRQDGV